jgi:hypothetical protein
MPKLDEDDFVDPGNLPQIAQSKTPPPGSTGGFGGGFGAAAATAPASSGFGSPSSGGFSSPSASGFGGQSTGGFGAPSAPSNFASAPVNNTSGQAAGAMHQGGESTVALDKDATDWINKKWRPVMGWVYMLTCTMDFVLFPILWSLLQALTKGNVTSQWQPLTLQGAGLYHIAMGAVLGIAAYGRTKEKVEGKAN